MIDHIRRPQWNITSERLERVKVVGPIEDLRAASDFLYANGFTVTYQGAYTDREMHPSCDPSRFLLHAERPNKHLRLTLAEEAL